MTADQQSMSNLAESAMQQTRLPLSSTRKSAVKFAKLLAHVSTNATSGFDFEGRMLRPGSLIDERELPAVAILLEGAGTDGSGKRNSPFLYLLWKYDHSRHEWNELARVWARSWEWAYDLGPIAERALRAGKPALDVASVAESLIALIDAQLGELDPKRQGQLAAVLHDRFATRLMEQWTSAAA